MDLKGLDVCNSLEQDKACRRGCCLKDTCLPDCLDSLTVGLHALLVHCEKPGPEAQTGPAEYLAIMIMSK